MVKGVRASNTQRNTIKQVVTIGDGKNRVQEPIESYESHHKIKYNVKRNNYQRLGIGLSKIIDKEYSNYCSWQDYISKRELHH